MPRARGAVPAPAPPEPLPPPLTLVPCQPMPTPTLPRGAPPVSPFILHRLYSPSAVRRRYRQVAPPIPVRWCRRPHRPRRPIFSRPKHLPIQTATPPSALPAPSCAPKALQGTAAARACEPAACRPYRAPAAPLSRLLQCKRQCNRCRPSAPRVIGAGDGRENAGVRSQARVQNGGGDKESRGLHAMIGVRICKGWGFPCACVAAVIGVPGAHSTCAKAWCEAICNGCSATCHWLAAGWAAASTATSVSYCRRRQRKMRW